MNINSVAFAAAFSVASSGGIRPRHGRDEERCAHGAAPAYAFGEPGKAAKVDRVIAITMHDLSFEPSNVEVKRGETIRFVVVNAGPIDHDFTIGDAKAEAEHRAEMAKMMAMGMTHGDEANAIMLKPGQAKELIWKFTKPGKLEFDCNIPGHCGKRHDGDDRRRRQAIAADVRLAATAKKIPRRDCAGRRTRQNRRTVSFARRGEGRHARNRSDRRCGAVRARRGAG